MSEALVKPAMGIAALQQGSGYSDEAFKAVGGSRGSFLPRIQLYTSNSNEVKRGTMELATFGLVRSKNDPIIKLGKSVLCSPLAWRAKAIDMRDMKNVKAFHNITDQKFIEVRKVAESGGSDVKCMFGPEFLMFLPEHGFATFFMGSATGRNESTVIRPFITDPPSAILLGAVFIETEKHSWHGPKATASDQYIEFPPVQDMVDQINVFLKPKDTVTDEQASADKVNAER